MNRWLAFFLGFAVLLAGGVVHGLYAGRWQQSTALDERCESVRNVPTTIEGWIAEDQPIDEKEYAQAGAEAYWARVYKKDSKEFLVILMVGPAKRMSIHTPEVCYQGAGFDTSGKTSLYAARDADSRQLGDFWSSTFYKPGAVRTELQLTWSWSDGGLWTAPTHPRWEFAGKPALYKLYLSQNVTGLPADAGAKFRDEFVRAFLPELNRALGIAAVR